MIDRIAFGPEASRIPEKVDPSLTNAGKLVLREAIESGNEERIQEFAQ